MKLMDMPQAVRPREKLIQHGAHGLKDYELLAILLRTGYQGKSVVDVAKRILSVYSLAELYSLPLEKLTKLKGVGPSRATIITAGLELARRVVANPNHYVMKSSSDIANAVGFLRHKKREHLVALYLDARYVLIDTYTVSIGTLTEGLVHPREVFRPPIKFSAVHVVIAHNHPSGDPTPSLTDISVTRKLVQAGKLLDIDLIDHVIVAKETYVSLKEEGMMGKL